MSELLSIVDAWIGSWSAGLWRASWQGAIALTAAWAIARFCTSLSPRVVCWVWRLACLKLLVALVCAQPLALALLPTEPDLPFAQTILPVVEASDRVPPEMQPAPMPLAPRVEPTSAGISIDRLLCATWCALFATAVLASVRQWLAVRGLLRRSQPATDPLLIAICGQEGRRLGVRRMPRLVLSSQVESPLLAGIWRPTIVLTARACEVFGEGEIRLMLAHELAHHRRCDLLWNMLPTLITWLFMFHPLVWLMRRGWTEAQEGACDELVLQSDVARPADYGRLLLKLASQWRREPCGSWVAAGVLGSYRSLERRILAMSRVQPFSRVRLLVAAAALSVVAAPGIIPWKLVAQRAERTASGAGQEAAPEADRLPGTIYLTVVMDVTRQSGASENVRGLIAVDPNTGSWKQLGINGDRVRLSPNGKQFSCGLSRIVEGGHGASDVFVADLENPQQLDEVGHDGGFGLWSPDGKQLLYNLPMRDENGIPTRDENGRHNEARLVDLATKEVTKLPIPTTDEVDDWSPATNLLVTVSDRHPPHGHGYQLYVMRPDGTAERRLTEDGLNCYPRFSPDGKWIVYDHNYKSNDCLWVVDIEGKNPHQVLASDKNGVGGPNGACWSPDGKWLAVALFDWLIDGKKKSRGIPENDHDRIVICAPDGTGQRVLQLEGVTRMTWLSHPEWK